MHQLIDFLKNSVGTGEIITIAYAGGSHPGQEREIVVISCSETDIRARDNSSRIAKQYKIAKIIWAQNSSGERITVDINTTSAPYALTKFETLEQYANQFMPELEKTEWYVHKNQTLLGVGTFYKNGNPKKKPTIAIYNSEVLNEEKTGRERPWIVYNRLTKTNRSFKHLHSAFDFFVKEINACNSQ